MEVKTIISLVQNLQRIRCIHGITQSDVATAIQVSIGTYSRWECTGFRSTKISDLINLLNYLEKKGVKIKLR